VLDLDRLHLTPSPDIVSAIIYAAEAADVRTVLIDGQIVMREGELLTVNEREVIAEARRQSARLFDRAALSRVG
jgi:5-methylthioadenosine/S-adenosylhomocysteine deaminase